MEIKDFNPDIQKLVNEAFDIALDNITLTGHLTTFVATRNESKKSLTKFNASTKEEAFQAAQEFIEDCNADTAVLAYQSTVRVGDKEHEGVICQIYDQDMDFGHAYAVLFRKNGNSMEVSDNKIYLGEVRNVLVY